MVNGWTDRLKEKIKKLLPFKIRNKQFGGGTYIKFKKMLMSWLFYKLDYCSVLHLALD